VENEDLPQPQQLAHPAGRVDHGEAHAAEHLMDDHVDVIAPGDQRAQHVGQPGQAGRNL
jgi:hypothetical protein